MPQDDLPPPKSRRPSSAGTGAEPSKEKAPRKLASKYALLHRFKRPSAEALSARSSPSPHHHRTSLSTQLQTREQECVDAPKPLVDSPLPLPITPACRRSTSHHCSHSALDDTPASSPPSTWNKDRPRPHAIDIAAISSHTQAEELAQHAQRSVVELAHVPAPAFGVMLRGELRAGEAVEGGEWREAGERGSGDSSPRPNTLSLPRTRNGHLRSRSAAPPGIDYVGDHGLELDLGVVASLEMEVPCTLSASAPSSVFFASRMPNASKLFAPHPRHLHALRTERHARFRTPIPGRVHARDDAHALAHAGSGRAVEQMGICFPVSCGIVCVLPILHNVYLP
ncbi:hypothetical protein OF83DRAFT_1180712 [Amylostereum chailletii]|nr:hypothetical protein OF83DRAFT_1180712 [Amylostereum chailletii]